MDVEKKWGELFSLNHVNMSLLIWYDDNYDYFKIDNYDMTITTAAAAAADDDDDDDADNWWQLWWQLWWWWWQLEV